MRRHRCSHAEPEGGTDDSTEAFLRRLRKQAGFAKMQHLGQAAPGLYIGAQMCSRDAKALQRAGVTHILSMNGRSPIIARLLAVRGSLLT